MSFADALFTLIFTIGKFFAEIVDDGVDIGIGNIGHFLQHLGYFRLPPLFGALLPDYRRGRMAHAADHLKCFLARSIRQSLGARAQRNQG